jgi:hypothetical protein
VLKCRDITELTTDFMEGALPPVRWMAMRFHLMLCPACSAFVDQMRRTKALLGRGHLSVSPETEAAIASRLATTRDQAP